MKAKTKFTRLWSLLLAIVMVVGLMPVTAFAARIITPINYPTYDVWLTDDGILHWTDTGSSSYKISIYQHPGKIALETINVDSSITEYDIYGYFDSKRYTQQDLRIHMNDHHDNILLTYESCYEKLPAPTNLRGNGNVAEWDAVSGANKYYIYIYDSHGKYITGKTRP